MIQGDTTLRKTLALSTAEITKRLSDVIGRELTTYIGNVNDVRAVVQWAAGEVMPNDASVRL